MKLTCFLTVLPFLGRTTQKSISGPTVTKKETDTGERTDATQESWGRKEIVTNTDSSVETRNTLDAEYNLVSLQVCCGNLSSHVLMKQRGK